ncbi:hypothetical protein EAH78_10670 [Pseudomonas arsenicoxydans]|uniref:Uncharacterized protein n=1 Tax=Pseudomonas arsenicoxydans TaxID=702115 RepID=A0A502I178_9PSED|nr:hypothetical protein EAH78_10670 [Pseudomonas arsenicoxydans]
MWERRSTIRLARESGLTVNICIGCDGPFASKPAPTGFFCGQKKRCTDQAHRKAVEHTTKCQVKLISPAAPKPRRCIPECGPSRRS